MDQRPSEPPEPASAYELVSSPSRLPGLVVSAVGYRTVDDPVGLHRGLPSPYLTFILSLDDAPIVGGESPEQARSSAAARATVLLAGLHRNPAYVIQPRTQTGIQLAVHPLAAPALFGVPTGRLEGLIGDGTAVLGAEVDRLRQRLAELRSWPERFDALWSYLRGRLARASAEEFRRRVPPALREAWRWLVDTGGAGSIDELSRHVGYSGRRLHQLFGGELGVGPKTIGRLVRFDRTRQEIAELVCGGADLDLGRVAAERGYYDHSHLIRDFHRFTGISPTAWIAEEFRNIQAGGHRYGAESQA